MIRSIMSLPDNSSTNPAQSGPERTNVNDDAVIAHDDPLLSEGLVRILVSMAENPEDAFQSVSLETLAEIG